LFINREHRGSFQILTNNQFSNILFTPRWRTIFSQFERQCL
jgi:hypothetical protein